MAAPFHALTRDAFAIELMGFAWTRRIWRIDMHHTCQPAHADYDGAACIARMAAAHKAERGFDDIAQHVSVAPDGMIWTGRDWNRTPASLGGALNRDAFMLEVIGNFDAGHDRLSGEQLKSVTLVIRAVQRRFRLPPEALLFHRDMPMTAKSCPGSSVDKADILARVAKLQLPQITPLPSVARQAEPFAWASARRA